MRTKLSEDARRAVIGAATQEVQRLGDRRVGTQHLLLALLNEPGSLAQRVLDTDIESARSALTELDRAALRSIGVDSSALDRFGHSRARRKPPFTSGFRSVLVASVTRARADGDKVISDEQLLRALLGVKAPDPAAALLTALGVDRSDALRKLDAA